MALWRAAEVALLVRRDDPLLLLLLPSPPSAPLLTLRLPPKTRCCKTCRGMERASDRKECCDGDVADGMDGSTEERRRPLFCMWNISERREAGAGGPAGA